MNYWRWYAAQAGIDHAVPTRTNMLDFLSYCFYDGCQANQIRQIRAAINNYARSHGLQIISDDEWPHAIQGYVSLCHDIHPDTLPRTPKILATWIASIFDD
ncbi:hypothetical protein SARC_10771 [Sphaeroforma arctica JP610]|uniref:Uncharacterized protein n=1 Tax=Sphaeroforma arctica JP610 TaxID=667725 RepID=A0A0L0FJU2_9EUKA|nr:hypothetical protein SARC_10771 [Sphaeroforma arctica JP610]KNC76741.1 hypothetical protein SARC_10771 [Sphaeroforma arctica JP610]|eukprot:XP_014150643.1 hypothetical protein SARC_10771 [Sphaeroforma arctica JP610]